MLALHTVRRRSVSTFISKLLHEHSYRSIKVSSRTIGILPSSPLDIKFTYSPVLSNHVWIGGSHRRRSLTLVPFCGVKTSHQLSEEKEKEKAFEGSEQPEKLSLVKRYKKMLKEYWYVLIPVHIVTSSVWFGIFYYAAKSGVDIVPFLEMLNLPETIIEPLRSSSLGYIAVASAFYKLATPARYMVTLGGTTVAIKQLTKRGLIKPVPSKAEFKTIIKSKLQSTKSQSTKEKS